MVSYSPRLPFPAEQKIDRTLEQMLFADLGHRLRTRYGPAMLYRAMLFWVRRQAKKEGVAYYAFYDMFGGKPHEKDRGDPVHLDDPDFEHWMHLREMKGRREWQRVKAKRRRDEARHRAVGLDARG